MPGPIANFVVKLTNVVLREFKHAPVGTIGALVAITDLTFRWLRFEGVDSTVSKNTEHIEGGLPAVLPLLEFLIFQIAISYFLHWSIFVVSRASIGIRISTGLLTTIVAAYLTGLNAFQIARFMIEVNRRHYTVFDSFWVIGIAVTAVLITAMYVERQQPMPARAALLFRTACAVLPVVLLLVGTCIFFDGVFLDRLHPIWVSSQNAALKW
jgi:hypothetical protein